MEECLSLAKNIPWKFLGIVLMREKLDSMYGNWKPVILRRTVKS